MRRTSAPRLRNFSRHAVDVVRCARCIRFHDGRAHGPSSRHETDMRHAASSVPGPSKSAGARQADESEDVALCPRQARLRIDGELFVSWSTRNAALIAALVQRRRNALHGVEVIDAAAIVLLTRRRRRFPPGVSSPAPVPRKLGASTRSSRRPTRSIKGLTRWCHCLLYTSPSPRDRG